MTVTSLCCCNMSGLLVAVIIMWHFNWH